MWAEVAEMKVDLTLMGLSKGKKRFKKACSLLEKSKHILREKNKIQKQREPQIKYIYICRYIILYVHQLEKNPIILTRRKKKRSSFPYT